MRLLLFSLTSFLVWVLMIYTIHTYAGRANANDFDLTVKHLAVAKLNDHGVELRSHPVMLSKSSSLAGLKGVRNGIQFDTSLLGEFHVAGSGAGRESTASGLISDLYALSNSNDSIFKYLLYLFMMYEIIYYLYWAHIIQ